MNPKRNRRFGKNVERHIAKIMGGKRMGILGKQDVVTDKFDIECKGVKRTVISKWFAQAKKNTTEDKLPLLVVHPVNTLYEESFVIIRLGDFQRLLEGGNNAHNETR